MLDAVARALFGLRYDVLLWSMFLEGTAKIHIHMLVVAPVKVRNTIDITSISEITKTTAMTTLITSLKLSFTDVVDCSLAHR